VKSLLRVFVCCCFVLAAGSTAAAERILRYHGDITIDPDASMVVEETIEVRAEGERIRRGIYRDFPTDYTDRFGNHYVVDFSVISVRRDGVEEAWHTERRSNGVRLYIGSADQMLAPGDYVYQIRYQTDRQLGFFEDHDELYWNVTGNGWDFAIDEASARVRLPDGVRSDEITVEAYTGPQGARGQHYDASVDGALASFRSTRALGPREGLTIVVGFPKGLVAEPSALQRIGYLLVDNRGLLLALLALVGSGVYLLLAWRRVGRDPEAGVIFAHYEPPEGFSPASARYISRMGYDAGTFSAAVVNLAVKGHLRISREGKKYRLDHQHSTAELAPGEAALKDELFSSSLQLLLENENHAIVSAARSAHRKALRRDYLNRYFRKNTMALLPSLLGSVLLFGLILLLDAVTPAVVGVYALNVLTHFLFLYLLKAPTARGRQLLDRLEGFKLYLQVAERDDLNVRYPPEKTPELFERYLPFAIALGVEQAWADQFTAVFAALSTQPGGGYQPAWYQGDFDARHLGSFSRDVGSSFTSAISSAASPPGSSSGGGGGGSSGGGGGGGGGGGW